MKKCKAEGCVKAVLDDQSYCIEHVEQVWNDLWELSDGSTIEFLSTPYHDEDFYSGSGFFIEKADNQSPIFDTGIDIEVGLN